VVKQKPKTIVRYGLMNINTGNLLGVSAQSNAGAEFCCDVQYILSDGESPPWTAESAIAADYVRHFSTDWYNADYNTPTNPYDANDLLVVEITTTTTTRPLSKNRIVPTFADYMQRKYNTPGMPYYATTVGHLGQNQYPKFEQYYCLHDLTALLRDEEQMKNSPRPVVTAKKNSKKNTD
jgi:hypothetical protein